MIHRAASDPGEGAPSSTSLRITPTVSYRYRYTEPFRLVIT